jgi:hypothetical protein
MNIAELVAEIRAIEESAEHVPVPAPAAEVPGAAEWEAQIIAIAVETIRAARAITGA